MQIHTNKILDSRKYITYRLREIYHFSVCLSDGNHLIGDVHSTWAACVYRTTGRLGYHSVNWCSYNCNTRLRRRAPAVCLHSTATTRELYLEEDWGFFFLIVIVNNNDLSSFKKNISICYATPPMVGCLSGSCRHLIRLSWHFSINHSHSCVGKSLVRVTVRPRHKKWPRQGWNPGLLIKSPAHCSFGRWIPLPSYYSLIPY